MNHFGYYVLNLKPTILSFIGTLHPTPKWLIPDALLEHLPWWHGRPDLMLRRKWQQMRSERARIPHGLMVNAPDEDSLRKLLRVKGEYVSHQIYIDKDTLAPLDSPKVYDAVYIAQLQPFKRIHLAEKLPSLMVIAGDLSNLERTRPLVPRAVFNDRVLSKLEICRTINSAYCTLALSKIEGAMLASFESLLCGIPVVSTRSKGGRDVFFNDYNSLIVDSNPTSVLEAVNYFKSHQRDPDQIRARALADVEPHKRRFCNYVSNLAVCLGGNRVDPDERYERYFARPGGLTNLFIWADKFDRPQDVERINETAPKG